MMEDENPFEFPKLSEMCIKVVASNFDRFMVSRSTGNPVLLKNLTFLQKAYSKKLFQILADTEYFTKYVDFLLNRCLKEIDLNLCKNLHDTRCVVEQLKSIGDSVENLILSGFWYTTGMLLDLTQQLPNIKSLIMCDTYLTDDILQNIGRYCGKLETLSFNSSYNITDAGIQLLCPVQVRNGAVCKNHVLKYLDLQYTDVTTVGLVFILKNFPNLTTLLHRRVPLALYEIYVDTVNSLRPLETYRLNQLIIEYNKPILRTDFLKMCPMLCPDVTKLTMQPVTLQAQIEFMAEFQKLKDVHFCIHDESIVLSSFIESRGRCLEKLRIRDGTLSVESLLDFCPKLSLLDLQFVRFSPVTKPYPNLTPASFQSTKKFKSGSVGCQLLNLKLLSIEDMDFGDDTTAKAVKLILLFSPNLEILNFTLITSLSLEFIDSISHFECFRNVHEINITVTNLRSPIADKLLSISPNVTTFTVIHHGTSD